MNVIAAESASMETALVAESPAPAFLTAAEIGGDDERLPDAVVIARCKGAWRQKLFDRRELMIAFGAEPNRDAVKADYAARLGKSVSTLKRMFYDFQLRGLQALVPSHALTKPATDSSRLPPETLSWFRAIYDGVNSDSVPQARRIMLARIKSGEHVPGIGTWRAMWAARFPNIPPPRGEGAEYPRNNLEMILPRGLSERSLNRHKPELVERLAAKQGTWTASGLAPMVYTTRVGVKAGQVLIFDDVWHNQNVNYMGSPKALRPLELCCIDLLSGHKVAWGARPRLWNPETRKHEGIKEREFRFLLAYVLCEGIGYRADGTILWLERGTAALDDALAEMIKSLSGGAITTKKAPLKDARQLCSIYRGVASGNPRFKGHLEASHSIHHTALSSIVGQIGRNADVRPEEIFGRDKANELLVKIAAILPPELAARVEMPYLHWDEYMECVSYAYNELAWRRWHSLEGWEAARHYTRVFCLPGTDEMPMEALDDMPPDAAAGIKDILRLHPEWCRIQPMAPIEVWRRHANEMRRLPKCGIPLILGSKNGVVRACPDAADLRFSSRDLGPDVHIYSREYLDDHGEMRRMVAGRDYLFHINPFSPSRELFISTPEETFLGSAQRVNVPCRVDQDAVLDQIKRKRAEWGRIAARVQGRHLNDLAAQALGVQRNAQLVSQAIDSGLLPARAAAKAAPEDRPAAPQAEDEDVDAAILELCGVQ